MPEFISVTERGTLATVTLTRPAVHNAFAPQLIEELRAAFESLARNRQVRVVVLAAEGPSFCAGADLNWMRAALDYSYEQNVADAERLAAMFEAIDSLPQSLIGRIHGPALGGGVGLVACCDLAVAAHTARFGFTEVRLGLIPAVIAQYCIPKLGAGHARALFVTGELFTAERAFDLGLVHAVVAPEDLDATVAGLVQKSLAAAPAAIAAAKLLVRAVTRLPAEQARRYVVEAIAAARVGPEGQEGLRAFLEKRKPAWTAEE